MSAVNGQVPGARADAGIRDRLPRPVGGVKHYLRETVLRRREHGTAACQPTQNCTEGAADMHCTDSLDQVGWKPLGRTERPMFQTAAPSQFHEQLSLRITGWSETNRETSGRPLAKDSVSAESRLVRVGG